MPKKPKVTSPPIKDGQEQPAVLIEIPAIALRTMDIALIGDSPLISNAWSTKAKKMILQKQMKEATGGKEAKDPKRDFEESIYRLEDGTPAFPAVAFKNASVDACTFVDGMTKVMARGAFHVIGDRLPIEGKPTPREDMVRVGMGSADIRYRAEFKKWRVHLTIRYNAAALSPAQIINLFNIAGFAIGVGDWRPQKDGSFGMFHVAQQEEIK